MSTKKKVPIKPVLNFGKMKAEDVLSTSTSIYGKMNNLSSGFTAANSAKTATPPVSDSIRKIEPGPNTGHMQVWPMKYPGAGAYEVRYAQLPAAGGTPATWLSQSTLTIKQPVTISGLTPATTYIFQARALTKNGFTDWGDAITRIAV